MKNFDKKNLDQFLKALQTLTEEKNLYVKIEFETKYSFKAINNIKEEKEKYSNFILQAPSDCNNRRKYSLIICFVKEDGFEYWTEIFFKAVAAYDELKPEIEHYLSIPNDFEYLLRNL